MDYFCNFYLFIEKMEREKEGDWKKKLWTKNMFSSLLFVRSKERARDLLMREKGAEMTVVTHLKRCGLAVVACLFVSLYLVREHFSEEPSFCDLSAWVLLFSFIFFLIIFFPHSDTSHARSSTRAHSRSFLTSQSPSSVWCGMWLWRQRYWSYTSFYQVRFRMEKKWKKLFQYFFGYKYFLHNFTFSPFRCPRARFGEWLCLHDDVVGHPRWFLRRLPSGRWGRLSHTLSISLAFLFFFPFLFSLFL